MVGGGWALRSPLGGRVQSAAPGFTWMCKLQKSPSPKLEPVFLVRLRVTVVCWTFMAGVSQDEFQKQIWGHISMMACWRLRPGLAGPEHIDGLPAGPSPCMRAPPLESKTFLKSFEYTVKMFYIPFHLCCFWTAFDQMFWCYHVC